MGTPTKRPWKVVGDDEICRGHVLVAGTFQPDIYYLPAEKRMSLPPVAECKANARLIVRSVNSHDALVEALEDAQELLEVARAMLGCCGEGDGKDHRADAEFPGSISGLARIRAALRLAKGVEDKEPQP